MLSQEKLFWYIDFLTFKVYQDSAESMHADMKTEKNKSKVVHKYGNLFGAKAWISDYETGLDAVKDAWILGCLAIQVEMIENLKNYAQANGLVKIFDDIKARNTAKMSTV
jgi:hypothetical protein